MVWPVATRDRIGPNWATMRPVVAYYRVSIERQGRSGLGLDTHLAEAGAARTPEGAQRFAENVAPIIRQIQASGIISLRNVAAVLNTRGVRTARGVRWAATQVRTVLSRAGAASAAS